MDRKQPRTVKSRWPSVSLRKVSSEKPRDTVRLPSDDEPSEMAAISAEADQRETSVYLGQTGVGHSTQSLDGASPSMVPDVADLTEEELRSIPAARYRARYLLHNPIGPRWYRNHHLIPTANRPRPPPALARKIGSTQNLSLPDEAPGAGPSRSPSASPHATPTSSQDRLGDAGGRRTRKISQTAHDDVDLWDVTDPHGTNWHHDSPYDVGLDPRRNEDRMAVSESDGMGRLVKRPTPSPLSQSTSALHLQEASMSPSSSRASRRLSKRKNGIFNLFGQGDLQNSSHGQAASLEPASAVDSHASSWSTTPVSDAAPVTVARKLSKRQNSLPPSTPAISTSSISGPYPVRIPPPIAGKEKAGRYIDRIMKRISSSRRQPVYVGPGGVIDGRASEDWQRVDTDFSGFSQQLPSSSTTAQNATLPQISSPKPSSPDLALAPVFSPAPANSPSPNPSPTKTDKTKRIPPPAVGPEDLSSLVGQPSRARQGAPPQVDKAGEDELTLLKEEYRKTHRSSAPVSIDTTPFSLGKLTIANPDTESIVGYPLQVLSPMPAELAEDIPLPPLPIDRSISISPSKLPSKRWHEDQQEHRRHISSPPTQLIPPSEHKPPLTVRNSFEGGIADPPPPPPPEKPTSFQSTTHKSRSETSRLTERPLSSQFTEAVQPQSQHTAAPVQSDRTAYLTPWSPINAGASPPRSTTSSMLVWPSSEATESPRDSVGPALLQYDDSPLSRASMVVNPPTPNATPRNIPAQVEPVQSVRTSSHLAPTVHDSSRQTETFRLVRSPSGTLGAQVITAHGQQWEVIESSEKITKPRERSRSKDRRNSSETSTQRPSASGRLNSEQEVSSSRPLRQESTAGRSAPPRVPSKGHSFRREKDEDKDRSSPTKKRGDGWYTAAPPTRPSGWSSIPDVNKPQPSTPSPTPTTAPTTEVSPRSSVRPGAQLQRRRTRPTSDVPSTNEPLSLKAREAWEAERLRKGRSGAFDATQFVTGAPIATVAHSPYNVPFPQQTAYAYPVPTGVPSMHGSSYTSFIVQAPHHGHARYLYPAAPQALQGMYQSVSHTSQTNHTTVPHHGSYDYTTAHGNFPTNTFPLMDPNGMDDPQYQSPPNPLPTPPRPSRYKSSHISPSTTKLATPSGSTPVDDYWAHRSGVATAR